MRERAQMDGGRLSVMWGSSGPIMVELHGLSVWRSRFFRPTLAREPGRGVPVHERSGWYH